jgi:polygalacturonase
MSPRPLTIFLILMLLANSLQAGEVAAAPPVNVKDFGAIGDGVADDTKAIQAAFATGKDVFIPTGTYLVDNVQPVGNQRITGAGWDAVLKQKATAAYVLSVNPGAGGTPDPATNVRNLTIRNLCIQGIVETAGFSEHHHTLNLNAVSDVLIDHCLIKGFQGDGIYLGSSNTAKTERHNQRVTVSNCYFDGINNDNRDGVSIIDGDGILIENCNFTRLTRKNMSGAINIEPNADHYPIIRNIMIRGNIITNSNGCGGGIAMYLPLVFTVPAHSITVENNVMIDTPGIVMSCKSHASETTSDYALMIRNNTIISATWGFNFGGLRGVRIEGNRILGSSLDAVINFSGEAMYDVEITGNFFSDLASTTHNGFLIANTSHLTIHDNIFQDCYGSVISFATGKSDHVTISDNVFSSPKKQTKTAINRSPLHLTIPAHNRISENRFLNDIVLGSGDAGLLSNGE